jgi:hypothetical protein
MMAALILIYLVALALLLLGKRKAVIGVIILHFILSLVMLIYHATDILNIRL